MRYQFRRGISGGQALKCFCMIHRVGRKERYDSFPIGHFYTIYFTTDSTAQRACLPGVRVNPPKFFVALRPSFVVLSRHVNSPVAISRFFQVITSPVSLALSVVSSQEPISLFARKEQLLESFHLHLRIDTTVRYSKSRYDEKKLVTRSPQ